MRNKVIAPLLLLASFAFAQEGSEYGSGTSFNSGSTYTTNTEYSTKTEYNATTEYSAPHFDKKDLYTHIHRGFYFSTSLTFAYMDDTHTETSRYDSDNEKENAYGYLHPYAEIRLGGSIANVASVFGAIGVGTGSGSYELHGNDRYDKYKVDATLLKLLFGVGAEFYPIQDKENPAYGLFLGLTIGLGIDGAFYDTYDSYYNDYSSGDDAFINYMFRFEIGKEWWFSRRWSVGIAFNYTYGTYSDKSSDYEYYRDKDEYSGNTFGFTVRLTH